MRIISSSLLEKYKNEFSHLEEAFHLLEEAEMSTSDFSFYDAVASVFSSKIEGENIDLDSFVKHKALHINFQPDYTQKTDDLYEAYTFAKENKISLVNIKKAHEILAKNYVQKNDLGKWRKVNMFVASDEGKIEYVATSPYELEKEMQKWNNDLEFLLSQKLSYEEIFYYASMLHLTFVKIHPWIDGNGRTARLIEKWFIANQLGKKAWLLQSEKFYYQNLNEYYRSLKIIGLEYESINYDLAYEFIKLLPKSFEK